MFLLLLKFIKKDVKGIKLINKNEKILIRKVKKNDKYFQVILNLNRKARLEQLGEILKQKDFQEFKKTATKEDLDDFNMQKAIEIMIKNNIMRYSRIKILFMFDPTIKKDFFHKDIVQYLAYDSEKKITVGYSSWCWNIQFEEHCFAQQVYVLPEYRRKGLATELLKIHLPNVKAIFADTPNESGVRIYQKNFDMSKVIFGRIDSHKSNLWIPLNGKELVKQIKIYDPNPEKLFKDVSEEQWEKLDNRGMIFLQELLTKREGVIK